MFASLHSPEVVASCCRMLLASTWSPATARKVQAATMQGEKGDDMLPVTGDLFERVAYGDPLAETEKKRYISELLQGALASDGIYEREFSEP